MILDSKLQMILELMFLKNFDSGNEYKPKSLTLYAIFYLSRNALFSFAVNL